MYTDLKGKVAVVTGASKGIGNAVATRLANENMKLVFNYNSDEAGAQKAVDQIKHEGGDAVAVQANVAKEEDIQKLVDTAVEHFGTLDLWINNAGMEKEAPTHELSLDDWNKVINVNLTGTFLGTKAALNYFLDNNKQGNIINMSSVHQQISWPHFADYAASKGGSKLLTETVAKEYAEKNIRVNAIAPGAINTPINAKKFADPKTYAETAELVPMGRIGKPNEVAAAAAWLSSDESSYVTGDTIFVDGGMKLYPAFNNGRG
ncbi:glucose-1-dehydrogenase [Apilactobacillus timberlakei]|uniref:Gdh n=1 Tax=Apilactobacillus timberlakei TaxID=2008380 RepID=A0A2P0QKF2_9LACO|nr:glucose-1-dehydrogenase [Apilactobacillus timberlakei]ARW71986.1 gdh [Apilactobacillus timberlakei]TPR17762.1 SDR family NAD(P)-dependent oxidoreductase [Apilactobacillus timberlakei]